MRCAALAVLLLVGCTSKTSPPSGVEPSCLLVSDGYGPPGLTPLKVETVVTGLEVPWGITFLPGGDWLVTERPGRVRLVHKGSLAPEPVLRVDVGSGGEGGLLGIAASPAFAQDRLFFVYATYTDLGARHNRVLRYRLAADSASAALDKVIFDSIPGALYHDGGRLRFGPDGMLYVGTGDGRQPERSQQLDSPGGKLLRLTPEGEIPLDNPSTGSPVFLSGIRNTEGFDWLDAHTLAVTDHGPSGELGREGHDEVNLAKAGQNLGWPGVYGCDTARGKVTPSLTWTEAVPPGGAAIYTGRAIPEWRGSLLVGTLKSKHLHRVVFDAAHPGKVRLHEVYFEGDPPTGFGRLRDVVMGLDGELYVTTSNCDGRGECPASGDRILRITR